jgi:hypothetical protein
MEQEHHILLSKQANIKKLALPLFMATGIVYFLVALNQYFFSCTIDYTFIGLGFIYGIMAFTYVCHTSSQFLQKLLISRKTDDNQ